MNIPVIVFSLVVPVMVWAMYFRWKDKIRPEPWSLLSATFAFGAVAGMVSFYAYQGLPLIGLPDGPWNLGGAKNFLYCVFVTGPLEEIPKALFIILVLAHRRAFNERIDGILYASVSALGFATFENMAYAFWAEERELVFRALAAPLAHMAFACMWGHGVVKWRAEKPHRWAWVILGLSFSFVAHGVYNWGVVNENPRFRIFSALLILLIWVWILFKWREQQVFRRSDSTVLREGN